MINKQHTTSTALCVTAREKLEFIQRSDRSPARFFPLVDLSVRLDCPVEMAMAMEDKLEYHLDPKIRFSCVICNVFKPSVGKFLKCLHVVCVSCARDNISDPGVIECKRCSVVTSGKFPGADLVEQLPYYRSDFRKTVTGDDDQDGDLLPYVAEREPDQLCYGCELSDVERKATHHCPTCASQPLCEQHADRHPLTRSTRDHSVEPLTKTRTNVSSQKVRDGQRKLLCCVHKTESIVTFCQTCNLPLCGVCLASGHDGHCIQTLTSAAQERRELLHQALAEMKQESMTQPSLADPPGPGTAFSLPFRTRLQKISGQKEDIQNDAEAASKEITDSFDSFEEVLQQKRAELLNGIDEELWRVLDSLEKEEQRLKDSHSDWVTAVETAEELASSSTDGTLLVVELGDTVTERLSHVSATARRIREGKDATASVRIIANTSMLNTWSEELDYDDVVTISSVLKVGAAKICEPTDILMVGCKRLLSVQLMDSNCHKVTNHTEVNLAVSAVITEPGGKKTKVSLSLADEDEGEHSLQISFRPKKAGIHQILLKQLGRVVCVPFTVHDVIQFDPKKCSPGIELSDNRKVVKCISSVWECAAAESGYVSGRHQWYCKVPASTNFYAGVCRIPSEGKFCAGTFFQQPSYSWMRNGHAHTGSDRASQHDINAWEKDDIIMFTLDCDSHTLECHCERTGEGEVMTDLDCTEPLYPAVCV